MGEYRFACYQLNSDGTTDWKVDKNPIAQDILDEYQVITQVVIDIRPIMIDYECASRNRDALLEAVSSINERARMLNLDLRQSENFTYESMNVMNQHVNNFLYSARVFIDRSGDRLKRLYGERSAQCTNFRCAASALYDSHFSYRFVYGIRNYAIHCDLPLSLVQLSS
jgi:hypothetical protein